MLIELLVGPALEGLKLIPSGRGKRKQAVKFQRAAIQDLSLLRGEIEAAANAGEGISGFGLKMIVSQLGATQRVMETTADAIDDDTPEENK